MHWIINSCIRAVFHAKEVKDCFLIVYLWERNTSPPHVNLEPTDSLPAEIQAFRSIIFIDASMPLNRERNFKITISFGSFIFKIAKENFYKHFARTMFKFGKEILKNDSLHPEQKLSVIGSRDGYFLLSHHSTCHISKDFTSQGVNNL